MGRNGQLLREGAEALGVSHQPLRRNAGALRSVQLLPERLPARRQARDARLLPAPRGGRRRAGARRGRGAADRLRAASARPASSAGPASPTRAPRAARSRSARGAAVILAGGAFGTPELLLRSGFRSASGELGRNLRIHPACWVGARFDEEVRGWDGVMQSYAVDEWERRGILLEATFTPLAFGGQWLPGIGVEHQERLLAYDRDRIDRRPPLRPLERAGRRSGATARCGSATGSRATTRERLVFGIARAAELFYAAGAREVYPQISGRRRRSPARRIARSRGLPPASLGGCGSRRFTRWEPRAWTPTRAEA